MSHSLPEFVVDCRKFLDSNALGLTVAALSSYDPHMRSAAYSVLAAYYSHMEGARFREQGQVREGARDRPKCWGLRRRVNSEEEVTPARDGTPLLPGCGPGGRNMGPYSPLVSAPLPTRCGSGGDPDSEHEAHLHACTVRCQSRRADSEARYGWAGIRRMGETRDPLEPGTWAERMLRGWGLLSGVLPCARQGG